MHFAMHTPHAQNQRNSTGPARRSSRSDPRVRQNERSSSISLSSSRLKTEGLRGYKDFTSRVKQSAPFSSCCSCYCCYRYGVFILGLRSVRREVESTSMFRPPPAPDGSTLLTSMTLSCTVTPVHSTMPKSPSRLRLHVLP